MLCAANSVNAAVIWDSNVDHSGPVGTAASTLAASLSTSASSFSSGTMAGWTAAVSGLSSGDILLIGQDSRTDLAGAANFMAINSFVAGGGTLIDLWGNRASLLAFPGPSAGVTPLLDAVTGETLTWAYTGIPASLTKTAATAGTSFAATVSPLGTESDHGGLVLSSIGSGVSMYELGGNSHVTMFSVGAGTAAFLSWDWCCTSGPDDRADWDAVMLAAATYSAVPEPGALALFGLGLAGLGFARRRMAA